MHNGSASDFGSESPGSIPGGPAKQLFLNLCIMEVTVIDVLKQLAYVIPSMIVGSQAITAAIHGAFKIENDNVNHAISWIVAILVGIGFVAFNGLDFGLGTAWNYVLGCTCGLLMGGTANGWYDWPKLKAIIDTITNLFGKK